VGNQFWQDIKPGNLDVGLHAAVQQAFEVLAVADLADELAALVTQRVAVHVAVDVVLAALGKLDLALGGQLGPLGQAFVGFQYVGLGAHGRPPADWAAVRGEQ